MNRIMTDKVMSDRDVDDWGKWKDLSGGVYDIISLINKRLPADMVVFVLFHEDTFYTDEGIKTRRIAVQGQQLKKISIESMGTVVLFTRVKPGEEGGKCEYLFQTQSDGYSTAKSPMGMFKDFEVPNDYELIIKKIKEYNN